MSLTSPAAAVPACGRSTSTGMRRARSRWSISWKRKLAGFRSRANCGRRRGHHCLHVGHDRHAQGGDALPSRFAGDLRHVCAGVLQPRRDDLFCGSPPLAFTFGLGGLLLFPLHAGAATLMLEKAGPIELLEAIAAFGVTTIFTAPVAYRTMASESEGVRLSDASDVRFGGRDAAESRLGAMASNDGPRNSRRDRQHGDAPHFRRFAAA